MRDPVKACWKGPGDRIGVGDPMSPSVFPSRRGFGARLTARSAPPRLRAERARIDVKAERWNRLQALFSQLVEGSPERRAERVAEAKLGPESAAELAALLAEHDR